jgi:glycosyltransferase involved in cell wall biosynthesis
LFDFEKPNLGWYNEYVKQLSANYYYFSNSQSTKNDFVNKHYLIADRITVAPLAASDNFYFCRNKNSINKIREKYGIPSEKKYVLSLCTIQPRKNLLMSVKAFISFINKNKIDDLVFALGGSHWEEFYKEFSLILKNNENKIITLGYIEDNDLAALYSGAEFFIYTSLYEGFGLPVLEAMQCGCPVITSNNSSLPEVIGDTGIMVDPYSEQEHAAAMEKYYFYPALRKSNSKRGLERAKEFSWAKTAAIMMNKFDKIKTNGNRILLKQQARRKKLEIKRRLKNLIKKLPVVKQLWSRYVDLKNVFLK